MSGSGRGSASYAEAEEIERAGVVEALELLLPRSLTLTAGDPERVAGASVDPDFFVVLGVRPLLGRTFRADEGAALGRESVALVGPGYWQRRFGSDPGVVGRPIVLDGEALCTVIGVLPQDAYIPLSHLAEAEVWKPLTASVDNVDNRAWRGFTAIGRLAGGATPESLAAELQTVRAQLAAAYPADNKDWGLRIVALRTAVVGDVS